MSTTLPAWALRPATPDDLEVVREKHRQGLLRVTLPDEDALKAWAKRQGWPAPWFGFEGAFITQMLKTETNFALALADSGVVIQVVKQRHTMSSQELGDLDELYEGSASWGTLVEALRGVRRAVEAGVVVQVEGGPALQTWQEFYAWAHGRYHMLEDGADKWIGDDA